MPGENEWVEALVEKLGIALQAASTEKETVAVLSHERLLYSHEVLDYTGRRPDKSNDSSYQTDVLIVGRMDKKRWIPRVVVECKLGGVTTHDALTYSTKASTHKHVHPYLRYGILVGKYGENSVPARLFRHGAYFDFMVTWAKTQPTEDQWLDLIGLLTEEIRASRRIQEFLTDSRSKSRKRYTIVRRQLKMR